MTKSFSRVHFIAYPTQRTWSVGSACWEPTAPAVSWGRGAEFGWKEGVGGGERTVMKLRMRWGNRSSNKVGEAVPAPWVERKEGEEKGPENGVGVR